MRKNTRTTTSPATARRASRMDSKSRPAKDGKSYRVEATQDRMRNGQVAKEQMKLYSLGPSLKRLNPSALVVGRKATALQPESGYKPLASVWYGEDAELLDQMLGFYPRERPRKILDATVNGGRFWRNRKHPVIGMDIEVKHRPDLVGNNTFMPFRDRIFDVVVYHPRHIPNQGKDKSKDFNIRFGLVLRS